MPIKAILWDIGGVLVRTMDRTPRTRLAERLGVTYAQLEETVFSGGMGTMAQLGVISSDDQWHWAARTLGIPENEIEGFQEAFFGGDQLDTGLVDAIRSFHASYRTGIISNALDNTRRMLAERWRITDAFDLIILSAEVGVMKPDARIFQMALEGLSVAPEETVFIDDSLHNVQGAQSVGLHAIHFHSPQQVLEELNALLGR